MRVIQSAGRGLVRSEAASGRARRRCTAGWVQLAAADERARRLAAWEASTSEGKASAWLLA